VQLQGGAVQLGHVPIDLDARFALRRGRLELAGEVGVGLLVVDVRGQGFFTDQHSVGIEWGVRGAASLRVWLRDRVAPVLGVSLLGVPAPVEFVVARGGVVGSDPKLWLDVSLGLAVRLQ
jgi:hypothetical protein